MVAVADDEITPTGVAETPPRRQRRWLVAGLLLLVVGAGAATYAAHPFRSAAKDETDNDPSVATAAVAHRSLASQTDVDGTLGYAGSYTVTGKVPGTLTWLPALGRVIKQGQVLYRVDGKPVVLLYGAVPAYRDLAEGASADSVTGRDVRQLNAALVALGYATRSQLDPTSDEFTWQTKQAVKRLQDDLGLDDTGTLTRGEYVFLPRAVRVSTAPIAEGGPVQPGAVVLTATSTEPVVSIDLDVAQQSTVKRGDHVTITLPDNTTTPGVVAKVGKVATASNSDDAQSSDSSATIDVTVRLRRPADAGQLDQAPVLVSIVTAEAKNALVVPINALLSLAGGGYAVEVATADGRHKLVAVTLGLFDDADGLVAVTGTSLSAGQRVVVPAS